MSDRLYTLQIITLRQLTRARKAISLLIKETRTLSYSLSSFSEDLKENVNRRIKFHSSGILGRNHGKSNIQ